LPDFAHCISLREHEKYVPTRPGLSLSHCRVIIHFMNYVLTDHARKRITKRQIRTQWIEETLSYPARIESDQDDSDLLHALRPIAERGFRVLRVIYNETVNPIAIVTAYFDDEVKGL
jgi:Domain of unknown function (DUF4258)